MLQSRCSWLAAAVLAAGSAFAVEEHTIGFEPSLQEAAASSSSLAVRVRVPQDAPKGLTLVEVQSATTWFGLPTRSESRRLDPGKDRVVFDALAPGRYFAVARHEPDSRPVREAQRAALRAGEPPRTGAVYWAVRAGVEPGPTDVELALEAGCSVAFRVLKAADAPASKVSLRFAPKSSDGVELQGRQSALRPLTLERRIETLAGRLVLEGLFPGEWVGVIQVTDHGRTEEFTLQVPFEGEREVIVPRFSTISGKILDVEGRPVAGAWVGFDYGPTFLGGLVTEDSQVAAYTDGDGAFALPRARPGRGILRATSSDRGLDAERELVVVSGEDLREQELELHPRK